MANAPSADIRDRGATPQRILAAATELFLRDGYGNTSLEQVAASAGVTKPTVYSHFGSKEGVLLAMTKAHANERFLAMSSALKPTGVPRDDLMKFGTLFIQRVLSDEASGWHRLALSESIEHPEIGTAIFQSGPQRVLEAIAKYIAAQAKSGRLNCSDPTLASEQFLGLLLGINPIRMITGQPLPSKAKQKRRCKEAVETFLAKFGPDAS